MSVSYDCIYCSLIDELIDGLIDCQDLDTATLVSVLLHAQPESRPTVDKVLAAGFFPPADEGHDVPPLCNSTDMTDPWYFNADSINPSTAELIRNSFTLNTINSIAKGFSLW